MILRSVVIDHAVIFLILVGHAILVHFINSVINLIVNIFDVIDALVSALFLPASLSLLNFGTLLFSLMLGIGRDSLTLKHTAIATGGASFLENVFIIVLVKHINDVPALIDIEGVVNCVFFVDSALNGAASTSLGIPFPRAD